MEAKRIKCPNCSTILDVRNSKNESVKLITCPKCKATLSVKFKKQEPLEASTYLAPSGGGGETQYGGFSNGGETQLGGNIQDSGATQLVLNSNISTKNAYLEVDGKKYLLSIGTNIVGRKASTSQATLQIETSDRYMSRQHAKIVVSKMPDGKLKAVISNDHNKNITIIDGQDLLQGDAIVLTDGDRFVMGKTTVIYSEQ